MSCFVQGQIAANRKGRVSHTGYCSGLGGKGLPQASLLPWPHRLSPSAPRVGGTLMWLRASGAHASSRGCGEINPQPWGPTWGL